MLPLVEASSCASEYSVNIRVRSEGHSEAGDRRAMAQDCAHTLLCGSSDDTDIHQIFTEAAVHRER